MPRRQTEQPATEKKSEHPWLHRLRVFALWIAVAIGCLSFSSYIVVRWIEQQILTTDNWVNTVSPLPKQPIVSTALGGYISGQVFNAADVQQRVTDALPPRAGFLAAPLTSQLQSLTTRTATTVVASDGFQTIWAGANRAAMGRLLAVARGQTPPVQQKINDRFNIDIGGAGDKIRGALGKASEAVPALQPASQKTLRISTDLHAKPRRIHQVIRTTDKLNAILPYLTLASFMLALALAWRRRRTLIVSTVVVFLLLLLELIALKWLRQTTIDQVRNPANVGAVTYIYDTVLAGLKSWILWILVAVAVVFAWCIAAGTASWAVAVRSVLKIERLQNSQVADWWHILRAWMSRYKYYAWIGVVALVLIALAIFATITGQVLLNALLLIIALCSLVYIIATPRPRAELPA